MHQEYWNFLLHIESIKTNKRPLNSYCHRSKDLIELRKNKSILFQDIHPTLQYAQFERQMHRTAKEENN